MLPSRVLGLPGDAVADSLRLQWGTSGSMAQGGSVVCLPRFEDLTKEWIEQLKAARMVLTGSHAVAATARAVCEHVICVEIPQWEPVGLAANDWITESRGGFVHHVAVEMREREGDLRTWLMEVLAKMVGFIELNQTFESAGLDSLSLISLARRVSSKLGRAVSVVDLYDHPSAEKLLLALGGGSKPKASLQLLRVVALHGFRSNREALQLSLAPYVSATSAMLDWIFLAAPRLASGPSDPSIPQAEAREWWGAAGASFETGWMIPACNGLEASLSAIQEATAGIAGLLGFSQGGAAAVLAAGDRANTPWLALFSPVVPPGLAAARALSVPSFHSYDLKEEFAEQCIEVSSSFKEAELHMHSGGHVVPQDERIIEKFVDFVSRNNNKGLST
eukprot:NODE_5764_length_1737_cov_5.722360.p1 GENE.NODE_5764_length_1737_cov_5.722360~~NODE_5764_length_1737_cov_5.722360.p1  ORF type:complete len:391 (+),score=41.89 NODE_5764_length_1737_cov_5.722360:152-1324(+)